MEYAKKEGGKCISIQNKKQDETRRVNAVAQRNSGQNIPHRLNYNLIKKFKQIKIQNKSLQPYRRQKKIKRTQIYTKI